MLHTASSYTYRNHRLRNLPQKLLQQNSLPNQPKHLCVCTLASLVVGYQMKHICVLYRNTYVYAHSLRYHDSMHPFE